MQIAIFAALPQEYHPLQKMTSGWQLVAREPFRVFRQRSGGKECLLVETGMGQKQLRKALELGLKSDSFDLILSTGFAGSLWQQFSVGQVLLGERFVLWQPSSNPEVAETLHFRPATQLDHFCCEYQVEKAQIVTVEQTQNKMAISQLVAPIPSIMDMESTLVAQTAFQKGIPFICLRSISDALGDEIDYSLDAISDAGGRVQIAKVLRTVINKPALMGSFYASWQRSRKAAHNLAVVLTALLNLPPHFLAALTRGSQLLPPAGEAVETPSNGENS
jgi:nucleoside phosphorylase